jgi:serine/threonine protein kinase
VRAPERGYAPLGEVESDRSGVLIAARSEASGALVDIRVLAPALKGARAFMRGLGSDMNVLREVRHTNLVSVVHFDKRAGAVVYESVPGGTLTQLLNDQGAFDLAASLVLLEDCISGLEALHKVGVVHGNLTPDAVVVETTGAVLLRDAGLSAPGADAGQLPEQRPYVAPEILAGGVPTSASDLYAATAVFVESIGGRASKSAVRTDLRPLLSEGMAKDPSKRGATLDDFRRELDDYARTTLGEGWRKNGRALLTVAAAAHATSAIRVSSSRDASADGGDEAAAAVALLRSPGHRDPRILVGLGALGFAALLAVLVLARGFSGTARPASGFLPPNEIPSFGSSTPIPGPSGPAVVRPSTLGNTVGPTIGVPNPITNPTANSTGGPTPTPNPTGPPLISQSITFTTSAPNSATYSGSYLTSATGGGSGNPMLFSSLSATVCKTGVGNTFDFVGVGNCTIQASQAGNSRYSAATNAQSFAVGKASQSISFTSSPTSPTYGGAYTVQATARGGPVTFSADPSSTACSVSPTGSVRFTAADTCVIDADQVGSADYNPAPMRQQQFDIAKASQTITFTSAVPCNPCGATTQYPVTADASSRLSVTFNIDSSSTPGSCSISGSTVTINGGAGFPGTCIIDAFQDGDQDYSAAPVAKQRITVS